MTMVANQARPLKMLLVEDSPMDTHLVKIALSKSGLHSELSIFQDGESALAHLRQSPPGEYRPDLIVLDLNLIGMDGVEVLRECKRDPDLRSIPIVVFTSSVLSEEIQRCNELGAENVVTKPVELEPFLRSVQAMEEQMRKKMDPDAGPEGVPGRN